MRVGLPAALLSRSEPDRRSLLKDQGHPAQGRGPHARGPGRSAGSCALIGYRRRRVRLLRTLRLRHTGSIVMTNAVGVMWLVVVALMGLCALVLYLLWLLLKAVAGA